MYRIESSSKRHIKSTYLGFNLTKTLAITRETSSEIYGPQYFKPKIKKVCHSSKLNIQYFLLQYFFTCNFSCFLACSKWYFVNCLWTVAFDPTRKSSAAKFTARKELEWRLFQCCKARAQFLEKALAKCFEDRKM